MSNKSSDVDFRVKGNRKSGFTLLEVMIAIAIFGLIMLYVSQLMNQQFRLFNSASKQNDLEHNTRSAMMHIIDELRFHHSKTLIITGSPPEESIRVFGSETVGTETTRLCLICVEPIDQLITDSLTGIQSFPEDDDEFSTPIIIYFDRSNRKLWYQDQVNNQHQLISDQIKSLDLSQAAGLLNIELVAEDTSINETFKLVSSIRLL